MHEVSLVHSLIHSLEDEYGDDDLIHLQAIDLKVGLLSNVEPMLMQSAFQAVTKTERKLQNVRLNIELIPIQIKCSSCNAISSVDNFRFICVCGQPCSQVVQGMELAIDKLHFDN